MINHRTFRARPLRALAAALATVAVSLAAAAPPASAGIDGPFCLHDRTSNACLSADWFAGNQWVNVHVGIDVNVPEQYGREILACGADFRATLRGNDGKGSNDPVIRTLEVKPGWPIAGSTGIAAELIGSNLRRSEFNEDSGGEDELYARVSFYDCHLGRDRDFVTGGFYGFF